MFPINLGSNFCLLKSHNNSKKILGTDFHNVIFCNAATIHISIFQRDPLTFDILGLEQFVHFAKCALSKKCTSQNKSLLKMSVNFIPVGKIKNVLHDLPILVWWPFAPKQRERDSFVIQTVLTFSSVPIRTKVSR